MYPKPIIAIDYDDVLMETAPLILDHYNVRYETKATMKDMLYDDLRPWGVSDQAMLISRVEAYLQTEDHHGHPPAQETLRAVACLAEHFELHIVTGRSKRLESITHDTLDRFFPGVFQSVIFTDFYHEKRCPKSVICKKLNAYLLIDDHPHHALDVAKSGMHSLLFGNYPWNQSYVGSESVKRATDWREVLRLLGKNMATTT